MPKWIAFEIDSSSIVGHNNAMSCIKASVKEGKYKDSSFCIPNGFIRPGNQLGKVKPAC